MQGNSFLAVLSLIYRQHSPPRSEAWIWLLFSPIVLLPTSFNTNRYIKLLSITWLPKIIKGASFPHALRGLHCRFRDSGFILKLLNILKANPYLCQNETLRYMGKSQTVCMMSRCMQPSASPYPKGAPNPTYFPVSHLSLPVIIISLCPMDQIWMSFFELCSLPLFPPSSICNTLPSCTAHTSFGATKK